MADPITALSLAASIVQLIDTTTRACKYLNEVKHATKERAELAMEAANLIPLLTSLHNRVQQAHDHSEDSWMKNTVELGGPDGPLEKFKAVMLKLQSKLKPTTGMKGVGKRLVWSFDKDEVKDLFGQIERFKTLVQLALQDDLMALSRAIKDDTAEITSIKRRVTGLAKLNEERATDEDIQIISTWLSPLEFTDRHNEVRTSRAKATGRWFLESDKFKAWLRDRPSALCCIGIPGAGKTVIASTVVDLLFATFDKEQQHIENSADIQQSSAVLYGYCDYKERLLQTPVNMIGGLLSQLIRHNRSIPQPLRRCYDLFQKTRARPDLNELSSILQEQLQLCARAYIVVDALDEYSDRDAAREYIIEALLKLQGSANLMVTSRDLPSITEKFITVPRIDIRAQETDLRIYLEMEVNSLAPCVKKKTELQELVISSIVEAVDGMFLLAQLYVKSLVDRLRPRDVKDALAKLPQGSGSTASDFAYDEAMRRIHGQEKGFRDLAEQILSWIVWAVRPLTVMELQHALSVEPGDEEIDEDNFLDTNDLISVCAGLVIIDQERQLLRLVHYTTQEYFERCRDELFGDIQNKIASVCITYLCLDALQAPCSDLDALQDRVKEYPFLAYAAPHWGHHVQATSELIQREYIMRLLLEYNKLVSVIQVEHFLEGRLVHYQDISADKVHAISIVAYSGLEETVRELLEREPMNQISEKRDTWGRTVLCAAILGGKEAVVRAIVRHGADVNVTAYEQRGDPPLCVAARSENASIVELLLQAGADSSSVDENGESGLHHSVKSQSLENTRLLLEAGSQLEVRNEQDETPLMTAILHDESESRDLVKLLLKYGANADAKKERGGSCLHLALDRHGRSRILALRILLEAGADMGACGSRGDSVLHYAVRRDFKKLEALELLLTKHKSQRTLQIALETRNDDGCTALHLAASQVSGSPAVSLLLESGASAKVKRKDGDTPLHTALEAVRMHCNENVIFPPSRKILHRRFSDFEIYKTVVLLLNAGADPLAENELGIRPIDVAMNAPQFEAFDGMKAWHTEEKAWVLELSSMG